MFIRHDITAGVMASVAMIAAIIVGEYSAAALVVPSEAVVNTGEHSYVFLAHQGGHFEPRMVTTGIADQPDAMKRKARGIGATYVLAGAVTRTR